MPDTDQVDGHDPLYQRGFRDGAESVLASQIKNRRLVIAIASKFDAFKRCVQTGNTEWMDKHEESISALVKEHLPHGSGFDSGTTFDMERSAPERLIFHTAFHHMDDNGYYDGWTEHSVIITPSLVFGYHIRVSGVNKRDIKDYIADAFRSAFDELTGE